MNLFEKLSPLSEKVGIIIPGTVDVNKEIDNKEIVEDALTRLSLLFGGATALNQSGGWVSDKEGLVLEHSTMVYAYADKLENNILNEVYQYAEQLARLMNQESVAVEINNQLYFVEQVRDKKSLHVG